MITKKQRLIIGGSIVLICLLLLLWILLTLRKPVITEDVVVSQPTENVIENNQVNVQDQDLDAVAVESIEKRQKTASINSLSKTFVERYGSYSNEANFENLKDVISMMAPEFAEYTQNIIDTSKSPDEYYGITTRVITVNVEELDEVVGSAVVVLNTQREESKVSVSNRSVWYQKIRIEFLKMSGVWKVVSASWL